MAIWTLMEYAAWALSALFAVLIVIDCIRPDTPYDVEVLTSSRVGALEAMAEERRL